MCFSGWSLRIILQCGGGGARSSRPLAPPPPCWYLILLNTQAQQYGGGVRVGGGKAGGRFDLSKSNVSSSGWYLQVNVLPPFVIFTLHSSYHLRRPKANPHRLQLISDEGNHFRTTLTRVLNSWPFFLFLFFYINPKLLIGTLAM